MTTRSSVLHISKLVFSAFVITIFATALHPGVGVIAAGSNHTTTARPALSQPENDLAFALLQEEPSHLELFYMDAPQLRVKERAIYVYLPPDYFTSEKSYPVLYLHDGQMVFSTNGGHDSRFNQSVESDVRGWRNRGRHYGGGCQFLLQVGRIQPLGQREHGYLGHKFNPG